MKSNKEISDERKMMYQIGMVLMVIGFLLFVSVFVTHIMNFGDFGDVEQTGNFDNFKHRAKNQMFRAIGGIVLIGIGKLLQSLGRNGVAGSGLILDTQRERKDLEPINRMLGGQLNDALEESNLKSHLGQNQIIKVRCQLCKHLNDEYDNFCGGCGKEI